MTLTIIDWLIILLYLILSLIIGLYYRKRASKSLNDFFLCGRNIPWYIAGLSMVATTFAADTPLAVTELVGKNGISGNWLWWNFLIGGMLTTFFFARLWRRANVLTELEFIQIRYSGRAGTFLRSFKAIYLGLFMNTLIIGWVNVALISILKVFFGIDEHSALFYVALFMIITALYSTLSGLWGVAITDAIQFVIAMCGCIVLAIIVVSSEQIGGIIGLKEKLAAYHGVLNFFPKIQSLSDTSDIGITLSISIGAFLSYGLVQWWASWYPGAEPGGGGYIAQRMMCTKNEKHSIFATLFFQIAHYTIRPWPWIIVGLCAIVLYPDLSGADKRMGYVFAMKDFLPAGLKGLLLVAFFSAYMSTISTQLNWGASLLTNDFYLLFKRQNKSPRTEIRRQSRDESPKYVSVGRLFTIIIMLIALIVTTQIETISGAWQFIIECGAGLGGVLILRWYWWRINAWSEISATITPFVIYAISKFSLHLEFPKSFFLTVGITTIVWLIVTFLTKPPKHETLQKFYTQVKPLGFWRPLITDNRQQSTLNGQMPENGKSRVLNLIICWLSSIIMTYSILFFTGKIIFHEWKSALLWGVIGGVSFIILRFFMGRTLE